MGAPVMSSAEAPSGLLPELSFGSRAGNKDVGLETRLREYRFRNVRMQLVIDSGSGVWVLNVGKQVRVQGKV